MEDLDKPANGWPKLLPCLWTGCGKLRWAKSAGDRYCKRCRWYKDQVQFSKGRNIEFVKDRRRSSEVKKLP